MYKIKLPVFEGPFDLLLFLIKKNEIDIYDIPIARITSEYLEYLEWMKMLDLEIAGEFIEMVATLILIKTRMLLPDPPGDDLEEVEDPRLQLTLQLLEYKRFKKAAGNLADLEDERRRYFSRNPDYLKKQSAANQPGEDFEMEATLFDLLTAFKKALDNMPKVTVHQVKTIKVTLEEQVKYIIGKFQDRHYLFFSELIEAMTEKVYILVTFLAILELIKVKMIYAKQNEAFEDIRLVPRDELSMSRYLGLTEEIDPDARKSRKV